MIGGGGGGGGGGGDDEQEINKNVKINKLKYFMQHALLTQIRNFSIVKIYFNKSL